MNRYLITGGGSGGHIYPALAIAEELKARDPKAQIILVGAKRGMEFSIFKETEYPAYFLPVGQLHSSVGRLKQLWSFIKLPYCMLLSFYILLRWRPKAVIGVGGYASGPLALVALLLRTPTYIWEGNAIPGITNKILGKFKLTAFLVFEKAQTYFKKSRVFITGVPLRMQLEGAKAQKSFSEKESPAFIEESATAKAKAPLKVLIVGGSQGARVFNQILPQFYVENKEALDGFHFILQTGLKNFEEVQTRAPKGDPRFEPLAYLDPIKKYYDWADLIICRAGAGTVNEISLLAKASILVPFPKASDNHQKKNAESMVEKGAALLLEEKDFNSERLLEILLSLEKNPARLKELQEASSKALPQGAREKIVELILQDILK